MLLYVRQMITDSRHSWSRDVVGHVVCPADAKSAPISTQICRRSVFANSLRVVGGLSFVSVASRPAGVDAMVAAMRPLGVTLWSYL